jgi:hypothetical protein
VGLASWRSKSVNVLMSFGAANAWFAAADIDLAKDLRLGQSRDRFFGRLKGAADQVGSAVHRDDWGTPEALRRGPGGRGVAQNGSRQQVSKLNPTLR